MTTAESVEQRRANRQLAVDEAYQTLNEYHIDRRRVVFIANDQKRRGGFGIVRRAHLHASSYLPTWIDLHLYGQPQVVAVKEINLSAMHDASDLKRAFTKEVLVWSRIKEHPGVARFLGFCADFGRKEAWLISPWEPYGNVSEFIKDRELEVPEKLSLVYDTLDALEFLHNLNPPVCHGDIKAANVLVNTEYRAVLCDFGLARLYEDIGFGRLESTAAMNKGSIRWCSPELFENQPRTASSDIYAWGWLVWEITTGEVPYEDAKTDYTILRKIVEGPVGQVNGESRLKRFLQLWDLMTRCWAADPLQRPTAPLPSNPQYCGSACSFACAVGETRRPRELERQSEAGLAYLEDALHFYEKEGNDKGIANVLRKQAAVAYRDSNFSKTRSAAFTALKKCKSLQDDLGVADALYWMAVPGSGREDSLRNMQESLAIFRAKGNSVGIVKCLQKLGDIFVHQGKFTEALPFLEEAVNVASHCGDRLGEADALNLLGTVHLHLDHMDQAILTLQRSRNIARSLGWEPGLSTSLCRLGNAKLHQGIHAEAEELFHESVRVAQGGWRLGQALKSLGYYLRKQGRHEEAISALEESCSVYQNLASPFEQDFANAAALLADSKSTLGHKEEALAWYDTAIAEYRKGGNWYKGKVSECLAAKDAISADVKRRDEGALNGEASS